MTIIRGDGGQSSVPDMMVANRASEICFRRSFRARELEEDGKSEVSDKSEVSITLKDDVSDRTTPAGHIKDDVGRMITSAFTPTASIRTVTPTASIRKKEDILLTV